MDLVSKFWSRLRKESSIRNSASSSFVNETESMDGFYKMQFWYKFFMGSKNGYLVKLAKWNRLAKIGR